MAKMCPVCAVQDVKEEKKGLCIHQKLMLGMMAMAAAVVIIAFTI
ncbi:MAG: hypothetical protein V3U31_03245 [Dehalococcoidia bacterium]